MKNLGEDGAGELVGRAVSPMRRTSARVEHEIEDVKEAIAS